MKLPWWQAEPVHTLLGADEHPSSDLGAQSCPGLQRVLDRALRFEKPQILLLGPFCGETAVYLAGRGARVCVEHFEPPEPIPEAEGDEPAGARPRSAVRIDQADGAFHLVLAWEQLDFTPPDRLDEVGAEIHRVLAEGGWLLLFARNSTASRELEQDVPGRYRVLADDRLVREPGEGRERPRWTHATREIERALAPLSVQGIHLQRNQVREFIALKASL